MTRTIRTALTALAATTLLASCGVAPQARVGGGSAPAGGVAPGEAAAAKAAARHHLLTVTPVCSCNAARGLGTTRDSERAISFAVVDNGSNDQAYVQVFMGTGTYEIVEPNAVDVVISGADVTITAASIPRISGTGPDPITNVVITFNTSTGAFTLTVNGTLEGTGTTGTDFRQAIPGSCDLPSPFPFPTQG